MRILHTKNRSLIRPYPSPSIWAASGQAALEASRILVVSSSATSTSILKNLVLPGIGHFSILDSAITSPADAGNNFFLNATQSLGKPRAQEAVPLLRELNESVQGEAVVKDLKQLLDTDQGTDWILSFSLVIAHNLNKHVLDQLSTLLWANPNGPPLISVRSAGFLAEFHIQYHQHCGESILPFHGFCPIVSTPYPFSIPVAFRKCPFTSHHSSVSRIAPLCPWLGPPKHGSHHSQSYSVRCYPRPCHG